MFRRAKKTKKVVRISCSVVVGKESYARLGKLAKVCAKGKRGNKGKADVIRQALQLYEYIVEGHLAGETFKQVDPDGREEPLIIFAAKDES